MNTQRVLDRLLTSTADAPLDQASAWRNGAHISHAEAAILADFGCGALTGGALGLLLGQRRSTRRLAIYGGAPAIVRMAERACRAFPPLKPCDPPPAGPMDDEHVQAMLHALLTAAAVDGHIGGPERRAIIEALSQLLQDGEAMRWCEDALDHPLDEAALARMAQRQDIASEVYLTSVLAIDASQPRELAYLEDLAQRLHLQPALKARLDAQAALL
ncbi:MAG: DUF533 domain-containing protein [Pseudoxanthomonas sp.]